MQVPKGHVWLQGDNLINSTDSRQYGPVPYSLLYGRVFLKVSLTAEIYFAAHHNLCNKIHCLTLESLQTIAPQDLGAWNIACISPFEWAASHMHLVILQRKGLTLHFIPSILLIERLLAKTIFLADLAAH